MIVRDDFVRPPEWMPPGDDILLMGMPGWLIPMVKVGDVVKWERSNGEMRWFINGEEQCH